MPNLSILIPARNEEYLQKTIDDIFLHSEADTEVIVGIDDDITDLKALDEHFKYLGNVHKLLFFKPSKILGQRALTNALAKLSTAKYILKTDAHVSFAQGFDRVLLEAMDDNTVMTPMLCRLDAKEWNIIPQPFTKKYYFDTNMVFQYGKREDEIDSWGLVPTMSLQGSCFVVSREKYFEWNLCDEKYGSWGFQGSETACKAWFNGGRVVTNTDTFYGHLFRGVGQNVTEIPYVRTKEEIEQAKMCAQELLKHPQMPELIRKFKFPADWSEEKIKELC